MKLHIEYLGTKARITFSGIDKGKPDVLATLKEELKLPGELSSLFKTVNVDAANTAITVEIETPADKPLPLFLCDIANALRRKDLITAEHQREITQFASIKGNIAGSLQGAAEARRAFPSPANAVNPTSNPEVEKRISEIRESNLRAAAASDQKQRVDFLIRKTKPDYDAKEAPSIREALQKNPLVFESMQRAHAVRPHFYQAARGELKGTQTPIGVGSSIRVGVAPAQHNAEHKVEPQGGESVDTFLRKQRWVIALGKTHQLTEQEMKEGVSLSRVKTYATLAADKKAQNIPPFREEDFPDYWNQPGIEQKVTYQNAHAQYIHCTLPASAENKDAKQHEVDVLNIKVSRESVILLSEPEIAWIRQAVDENMADPVNNPIYIHGSNSDQEHTGIVIAIVDYIAEKYPTKAAEYFPGYPTMDSPLAKLVWIRTHIGPVLNNPEQWVAIYDIKAQMLVNRANTDERTAATSPVAMPGAAIPEHRLPTLAVSGARQAQAVAEYKGPGVAAVTAAPAKSAVAAAAAAPETPAAGIAPAKRGERPKATANPAQPRSPSPTAGEEPVPAVPAVKPRRKAAPVADVADPLVQPGSAGSPLLGAGADSADKTVGEAGGQPAATRAALGSALSGLLRQGPNARARLSQAQTGDAYMSLNTDGETPEDTAPAGAPSNGYTPLNTEGGAGALAASLTKGLGTATTGHNGSAPGAGPANTTGTEPLIPGDSVDSTTGQLEIEDQAKPGWDCGPIKCAIL